MCGHSYHGDCLMSDGTEKECQQHCKERHNNILERKQHYDMQVHDTKNFFEKLPQIPNKFDVVAEYLGKGLFRLNK